MLAEISMTEQTIEQVQHVYTAQWMDIPGVQGTAIGQHEGSLCILILSSVRASDLRDNIPESVQGYPVVIKETGTFHTRDE